MEQTSKTPWGTTEGLYDPSFEHDNCGIGAIVNIKGTKTHQTVEDALKIVENLEHRAGKDAEGKTGDGVGILLQISHQFFSGVCKELGYDIGDERDYGIGMFFLPQNETDRRMSVKMFEIIAKKEGVTVLGWRMVPVAPGILGSKALDCMPCIMQCFLKRPSRVAKGLAFDRKLYVIRRIFEQSNDNTIYSRFQHIMNSNSKATPNIRNLTISVNGGQQSVTVDNQTIGLCHIFFRSLGIADARTFHLI